jgi:hypothetical protein
MTAVPMFFVINDASSISSAGGRNPVFVFMPLLTILHP